MFNGIINIRKEPGYTSFDVVASLRGMLRQKRIGHTGTLDPMAEGVLPVCLGTATKVVELLTGETKQYQCTMLLGCVTDTQDMTGTILRRQPVSCSAGEVRDALLSFIGEYSQIPPMYSAVRIQGKHLYELAREGKEIERRPRLVHIYDIEISEIELPRVTFLITCSPGTYIRTLCEDTGTKLGCGACMEKLVRVRVGPFDLESACTLDEVRRCRDEGTIDRLLLPADSLFPGLPRMQVLLTGEKLLQNGNPLRKSQLVSMEEQGNFSLKGRVRVYFTDGTFAAIYRWEEERGIYLPEKMFL